MAKIDPNTLGPNADRAFDVDLAAPGALAPMTPEVAAAQDAVEAQAQKEAAVALQRIQQEEAAEAPPDPGAPPAPEAPFQPKHGSERWPVKTVNDDDRSLINPAAQTATVRDLWKLPRPDDMPLTRQAPQYQSHRAQGPETTIWQVEGYIIAYKWEQDGDFHIVLQDVTQAYTMIVETPQSGSDVNDEAFVGPSCPPELRDRIEAARATLQARLNPRPGFASAHIHARITGIGFFDFKHGQLGFATTNGIELHPILDVEFL